MGSAKLPLVLQVRLEVTVEESRLADYLKKK